MAQQNLTIWQRLGNIFRDPQPQLKQTTQYNFDTREILKTQSKEEYEIEKLQKQQTLYLHNQWQKVDSEMYQQAIFYETTRIAAYTDFESMEFYPELSAALDIMMEESCTVNSKGKLLNIYSESERVKKELENLFYNNLNIHTSLPMWTRNTCKYGDNFIYLNIDESRGVVGAKQLPNIEIERWEGDLYAAIQQRSTSDTEPKPQDVKFVWKSKEYEFKSWQIAHFRLLTDDRRLPYGVSMLEKARRIYKQLMLAEDAMLIYRVTRAPERRVFKIFVGNLDDKDIEPYVNQVANKFKRTPLIDSKTGQMDLRYNQIAQDQDFFIPVRDINAPNPIDTLPGAQNLSEIQDIEYLQKKMFTSIRVPKTFLGFEEAVGEGKNLALQDIRFARTINRIQQAMLQELNKIAIIHLFILGLDDELENFTLTLNNPSTQAEMLKIEHLAQKMTLYKDSVADAGNGFAAMSMTRAKKEILNMSDDEIRLDLEQQRIEKAAAAELANTAEVIKSSGVFTKVDKIYGEVGAKSTGEGAPAGGGAPEAGGGGAPEAGGGTPPPTEPAGGGAPPGLTPESIESNGNLLLEREKFEKDLENKKLKYQNIYFDKLLEYYDPKETLSESLESKIEVEENKLSNKIQDILSNIDTMLDE
jgi:hypothetical protein